MFAGHNLVLPFVSVLPPLIKRHENRIFHLAEGQEGVQLRLLSPTQLCTAGHTQLHHSCSLCSILWVGSTCTAQGRPFQNHGVGWVGGTSQTILFQPPAMEFTRCKDPAQTRLDGSGRVLWAARACVGSKLGSGMQNDPLAALSGLQTMERASIGLSISLWLWGCKWGHSGMIGKKIIFEKHEAIQALVPY